MTDMDLSLGEDPVVQGALGYLPLCVVLRRDEELRRSGVNRILSGIVKILLIDRIFSVWEAYFSQYRVRHDEKVVRYS